MKKYLEILLLVSVLSVEISCNKKISKEEDVLYRVECFHQMQPDKAMQTLDSLDVTILSRKEKAHYCLLKARTMSFLQQDQNIIDSLLHEAEKYYSGSNDKYHEAMTYWQIAWTQKDRQHMFDYRLKALQTIGQCEHVDERLVRFSLTPTDEQNEIDRLKYAIHQRLGMSYAASGYHREGIEHLKLSEQYYLEKQRHNLHINSAYMLGLSYAAISEYDSSMMYYEKGLQSAEIIGDTAQCAYYHNAVSECMLYRHDRQQYADEEERLQLLHKSVAECLKGLEILDNSDERIANTYRFEITENLSRSYFELQKYDSCIYYGQKVFDYQRDKTSKFQLKNLYKSYKALNDEKNAAFFADLLINLPDNSGAEQKAVAEVKEEYDRQMKLQQLQAEHRMQRTKLYLVIAAITIIVLVMSFLEYHYRKNKEFDTLRLREERLHLQSDKERMSHQMNENLLGRVRKIHTDQKGDTYRRIVNEFNATYPKVHQNLKTAYPYLTEHEIGICILGFLSFRAKETAQLLGFRENTIGKYRSVIRNKTGVNDLKKLIRMHLE